MAFVEARITSITPGANAILNGGAIATVPMLFSNILNYCTIELLRLVKNEAPKGRGRFADAHAAILVMPLQKFIVNTITAAQGASYLGTSIYQNGEFLWKFIVNGHVVLRTAKADRWWFWYLTEHLGGFYDNKTGSGNRYVPPDDYPSRAINELIGSGYIQIIAQQQIQVWLSSGGGE